MGKSKRKHNWKARLQPDVEIRHEQASEIKIELPGVNEDLYDESNALVLPSKKRATKVRHKQETTVKKLSRKQRKILENVLKTKNKKAKRTELFESLQKVQASAEELSLLSSTSDMHSGRLKRKVKIEGTTAMEDFKIKSVGGGKKRKIDDSIEEQDESDTSDEPTDEETEDESDTNNEEIKDSISETDEKADLDDTTDNTSEEKKQENACTNKEDEQQQKTKPIVKEPLNEAKQVRPTVNIAVHREELIQKQRLKLPILAEEQVIVETINENPVTVIAGETGSGKTTQLPQFLYEAGYAHGDGIIGITEPRRVAAISMSKRVAKELNLTNREVSYQIRYEGNVTEDTKIKFMTDGVLLKEVQKDFLLTKYSVIIIDEAHERSVYTDILIGLLSRIVPLRHKKGNPLKLIIMSATLRVEDFTENERLFKVTPPVLKIDSRQYPVTIHFNKRTPLENYIGEAFKKICKIHRQLPEGGILVFVTGQQEVHTLCSKLRKTFPFHKEGKESKFPKDGKNPTRKRPLPKINLDDYSILPVDEQAEIHEEDHLSGDEFMDDSEEDEDELEDKNTSRFAPEQPMHVLPLYSLLSSDKQAKVFEPPPEGSRLCVVATNVAETSLTIPNVKYVVDTGKVKTKFYDKVTGVAAFRVTWTSQAAANQRSGRAGRTGPGHCYRLYSSAVFNDDFEKFSPPEISRRPVDDLVLQMKDMNIDKVLNFPYPTPPSQEALQAAEKLLITLGALEKPITTPSNTKSAPISTKITKVGRAMASFPVSPRFGKMLCLAHQHNLMAYVVAMVAALSVQEVFVDVHQRYSSQNKEEETTKKTNLLQQRKVWAGAGQSLLLGDLMVLLKAVGACEFADCSPTFCDQYGIRYKAIKEVRKLRAQLTNTVNVVIPDADLVLDPKMRPPDETEAKLLRQIVLAGLADHVARKIPDLPRSPEDAKKLKHAYQSIALEDPVFIHPGSALYKQNCEYVVYQQIDETSKLYMKGISTVDTEWLPLFAPSFCRFSKPLETPEPRYDPSRDSVMCHMTSTFGPHFWAVEAVEVDYPRNAEKYKWFAKAFLGGKVCPKLEKYSRSLLSTPETMLKSWARLQPRTQSILEALMSHDVTSLKSLQSKWKTDKNYLKSEYKEWVPEVLHQEIDQIWPPT